MWAYAETHRSATAGANASNIASGLPTGTYDALVSSDADIRYAVASSAPSDDSDFIRVPAGSRFTFEIKAGSSAVWCKRAGSTSAKVLRARRA